MAEYGIFVKTKVDKEIADIPQDSCKQIFEVIESLSEAPHPKGSIKLSAAQSLYRVRVGDY
jgi:mRNA interferase RelE/StbE